MRIGFSTKGDFDAITKWLKEVPETLPKGLDRIAEKGVTNLKNNTPKDTGATANGWQAEVIKGNNDKHNIVWTNTAHPQESANIALLIELGHGTGTGGYVQPKPYIKAAMEDVWKTAGDDIAKELIK